MVPAAPLRATSKDGSPHVTDERAATITAMVGTMLALLGTPLLILRAIPLGALAIVVASVYGATLVLLFLSSALHHGIDGSPRVEGVLRTLDYAAIYALIGGTVTPLALLSFGGAAGWVVFGVTWGLALAGMGLRSALATLPAHVSNTLFIALGWLPVALLVLSPGQLPWLGAALLGAGGLFYSGGFVLYVVERPNPWPGVIGFHEIWHVCVLTGAGLHYAMMYAVVFAR